MTTTKYPRDERFVYVAEFDRPLRFSSGLTLTFVSQNIQLARDHADYVGWHDNAKVLSLRRATADEESAFREGGQR